MLMDRDCSKCFSELSSGSPWPRRKQAPFSAVATFFCAQPICCQSTGTQNPLLEAARLQCSGTPCPLDLTQQLPSSPSACILLALRITSGCSSALSKDSVEGEWGCALEGPEMDADMLMTTRQFPSPLGSGLGVHQLFPARVSSSARAACHTQQTSCITE